MSKLVIADDGMLKKLGKADETAVIFAPDGTVLGCFVPAASQPKQNFRPEINTEESAPRMADGSRGYTTTEVLLYLLSQPRKTA